MDTNVVGRPADDTSLPGHGTRLRLQYLDGIRGLACLWVVLLHSWMLVPWDQGGRALSVFHRLTLWADLARVAVAIFIVLSGYCLMLPVAQSPDGRLRGGVKQYFKRRAWRIVPPYYAALVLAVVTFLLFPRSFLDEHAGWWWRTMWPVNSPGVLLSHLAMVHNLNSAWIYKINAAMWSVATEWQIYFVFALVLLPVWRRFGSTAAVALAFAIGLAVVRFVHLDLASPWFIGLFALGMAAASMAFARDSRTVAWRDRVPWGTLAAVGFAFLLFEGEYPELRRLVPALNWKFHFITDTIGGAAVAALMIFCTNSLMRGKVDGRAPLILQFLEAPSVVELGRFSYSLYLVHPTVIVLLEMVGQIIHPSPAGLAFLYLVLGIPACIGAAYVFYLGFERPFVRARGAATMQTTHRHERPAMVASS